MCDPLELSVDATPMGAVTGSCTCDWGRSRGESTFAVDGAFGDIEGTKDEVPACVTFAGDPLLGDWLEYSFELTFERDGGIVFGHCGNACGDAGKKGDFDCGLVGRWDRPWGSKG